MSDLDWLGVADTAQAIANKTFSPVEAVEACLARIDRSNKALNAFISVYPDEAMDAARAAEAKVGKGEPLGPLHGVPLAVKDLFAVAGMQRTCGSRMLDEPPCREDAESVARLKDAGAIIVGLLNLHEFAFGPTGINPHFGTARNPWNRDRVCGGSSSGSGCAVASGLVPGSLGTDTGGSIRIPAALCGIVGLKPTHDAVSRQGIYPLCEDFDTGGPLARSVGDIALMSRVLGAGEGNDPGLGFDPGRDLVGIRIGALGEPYFDDLHPDIAKCVEAAIDVLREQGAVVEDAPFPLANDATSAWNAITLAAAFALHKDRALADDCSLSPDSHARILKGRDYSESDIAAARAMREQVLRDMKTLMGGFDVLIAPTTPIPAVSAETGGLEIDGRSIDGGAELGRLTRLASFTGQPAMSVPCGFTDDGLPVGLQVIGAWGNETTLFRIAGAYEAASPWRDRHPENQT